MYVNQERHEFLIISQCIRHRKAFYYLFTLTSSCYHITYFRVKFLRNKIKDGQLYAMVYWLWTPQATRYNHFFLCWLFKKRDMMWKQVQVHDMAIVLRNDSLAERGKMPYVYDDTRLLVVWGYFNINYFLYILSKIKFAKLYRLSAKKLQRAFSINSFRIVSWSEYALGLQKHNSLSTSRRNPIQFGSSVVTKQ